MHIYEKAILFLLAHVAKTGDGPTSQMAYDLSGDVREEAESHAPLPDSPGDDVAAIAGKILDAKTLAVSSK